MKAIKEDSFANRELMRRKKSLRKRVIIWSTIGVIVLLTITLIILESNCPRREYLSKANVNEAQISELYTDESNPPISYVKISLVNPPNGANLIEEQSWIEVTSDYYSRHKVGDRIGVLVGNYDVYKENNFGIVKNSGQTFEKSVIGVEDIFDNVDAANQAYPAKSFNADAQLKSKVNSNGNCYFILIYEDREMTVQVSNEIFDKYKENDSVECSFEGVGEFIKITSVT